MLSFSIAWNLVFTLAMKVVKIKIEAQWVGKRVEQAKPAHNLSTILRSNENASMGKYRGIGLRGISVI